MAPASGHIRKARHRRKIKYSKDWTFEDLVRHFGGNRVDAASQVCDKTIRYCLSSPNKSRYPLTPLCSPSSSPGRKPPGPHVRSRTDPPTPYRSSRFISETDPNILDFAVLTARLTAMPVVRCNKCHRYMEGAPDTSVGHDGSSGDARCVLDHLPDPCDYVDKRGKKCTEYGDSDPDFIPPENDRGARLKDTTDEPGAHASASDGAAEIAALSAKNVTMEANLQQMQNNFGKLSNDMATMMKMMAEMGKTNPNPKASLSDGVLADGVTSLPIHAPPVSSQSSPAVTSALLSGRVENLIISNSSSDNISPSIAGYTGSTIPELRKDKDLAALVRNEVQRLIADQIPALQKNVVNSDEHQPRQPSTHQQLADFQAQQKQQMEQFVVDQEKQFQDLQQQLGGTGNRQHGVQAPPARPTFAAKDQAEPVHPAYSALQGAGSNSNLAMDMETLMGMTVRSKQFRPYEFAARTQLFYAKNITERNCNLPCFVLGYLRHCLILMSGVVPTSENEVSSRLTNLMNICEIAANNSTLNDFDCAGWQIAKAYGDRVFHDVETGQKTWEDLPVSIMADTFLHAKDTVAMKSRKASQTGDIDPRTGKSKKKKKPEDGKGKVCTTYNTFRTGDGCAYELNSDRKCEFEHYCKKCFTKSGKKENHKALNCEDTPAEKSE